MHGRKMANLSHDCHIHKGPDKSPSSRIAEVWEKVAFARELVTYRKSSRFHFPDPVLFVCLRYNVFFPFWL